MQQGAFRTIPGKFVNLVRRYVQHVNNAECISLTARPTVYNVAEKPDEARDVRLGTGPTATRQCPNVLQSASVPARDDRVIGVVRVLYSRG